MIDQINPGLTTMRMIRTMDNDQKLAKIRELAALQAGDDILWALPMNGMQTAQEACLQAALIKLHSVIASDNPKSIDQIISVYKKQFEG